jgi:enoyl-[acyl-carrier protein] reductase I
MTTLSGKKGLTIGIANGHSLASGCARHFRAAGAELAITHINAKTEPYARPLARGLQSEIFMPCDVTAPGQLEAVSGASLRTGDASISCNTLSLTPARKI